MTIVFEIFLWIWLHSWAFFSIVHVKDTLTSTIKKEACSIISRHDLHVENILEQSYEGASNMGDEWNGLQSLFR
jgi:hypothetical protein